MADLLMALPLVASLAAGQAAPAPDLVIRTQAIDHRVTRTTDLPTYELQRLRRRMLADQRISFDDMRRLADAGDGLAAFRYGERLLALDDPTLRSAAALYFATAALTGKDYAVYELVKLLNDRDIDFSDKRLTHLENALRNLALQGSDRAVDALAEFYESGRPFGKKPDEVRKILGDRADGGDPEAAMELVRDMMTGKAPSDPARLRGLLETARDGGDMGTRIAAQGLLANLDDDTSNEKETAQ